MKIACFSNGGGSFGFHATREELSASQIQLLESIRPFSSGKPCAADAMSCQLTVTQADGTASTFEGIEDDYDCSKLETPRPVMVGCREVDLFRKTLACRSSKAEYYREPDASAPPWTIAPDPRCDHGVFSPHGGSTTTVLLKVAEPGKRHIDIGECAPGTTHLALKSEAGTQVLAQGVGADPSRLNSQGRADPCQTIDYTFDAAGTYTLTITFDSQSVLAGDFTLRFY